MKRKKTKSCKLLLLMAFLFAVGLSPVLAQEILVKGKVTDSASGEGIPGASIYIKGTTNGTITNDQGFYSIKAEKASVMVFSFIGYTAQEITVTDKQIVDVALRMDVFSIDEVVAVGYGTQKKKEITGAVTQVKTDELTRVVSSDFTKSLQGQVAGVNVTESSGRPGDQANIQIRGLGSISSDSSPLYVVDGIPYNSNPNIASEDIATVDILKDGASAAVYGTRASNGVVLITTKRGKAGETKVSFASYFGIQNITSGTPLLNTPQHLYVDEMVQQSQSAHSSILHYNPNAMDYNTDFVGAITNDNAPIQNYNITLSGGKDNLTFNVNSNYFNQDGILRQSGYDRFTTRANATLKKGKFNGFVSLGVMHSNKEQEPWGLYEFAMFQGPYRPPLGDYATTDNTVIITGNNPDHVGFLSKLLNQTDNRVEDSYSVSANLKYEIIKGLTYQVNLGMNKWGYNRKFWQPQYLVYNTAGDINEGGSRRDAILSEEFQNSLKYTMENILNYNKTFGGIHNVSGLIGYTIERTDRQTVSMEKRAFVSNSVQVFDGGSSLTSIGGNDSYHRIVGKLARAQYNYDGRYFISASIRQDGSSVFGPENRYGYFPGVSVGWNIKDENFMAGFTNIDNLKLRASYGEVGNQGIPPYLYDAYIDPNIDYVLGPESSDDLGAGAIQRGYGNPGIKWETNTSRNIGVDLSMFRGRFNFTADIYKNDKKDMLLKVVLPASTGTTVPNDWGNYNSIYANVGNMVNKGIELSASYKGKTSFGLGWDLAGTFTKNKNEIIDLGDLEDLPLQDSKPGNWRSAFQDITTYMKPGYEAGAFFLIKTDGIFKTADELAAHVFTKADGSKKAIQPNAQLGDVKMIDSNNDGVIDDKDRVYSGSGMPKFESGLILNLDYKGFDLNMQLYYSYGNKVYNGARLFAYSMKRHEDLYYMWTPQNPNSDIPAGRASSEHDNFRSRLDYYLEDGSFLRVRTLSLGYTIPKKIFNGKIDNVRFYVTGQNPFTFTRYKGYDPEIGGNGVSNRGVDKGNYPVTRKFLFGVNVDF